MSCSVVEGATHLHSSLVPFICAAHLRIKDDVLLLACLLEARVSRQRKASLSSSFLLYDRRLGTSSAHQRARVNTFPA